MRDSASATPSLHPAYLINKLNNYVKELNIILPNGTNIGGGYGGIQPGSGSYLYCNPKINLT
jgi:hypothetical protein